MNTRLENQRGFAMISTLLLISLLLSIMVGYWAITRIEQSTTKSTMDSFRGFYAAEAGLNLRAEAVRATFNGYAQPSGTGPSDSSEACVAGNVGSGDFACIGYGVHDRDVVAYIEQPSGASKPVVIARGETYQNLLAEQNQYVVHSRATNVDGSPEALLEMHFKSRTVPLFQFAAFYNKDLEIEVDTATLDGPIHANGNLYLGSATALNVNSQITTAGTMFNGPKATDTCPAGSISVLDPDNLVALPACSGTRKAYTRAEVAAWDGMIQPGLDSLTVPPPTAIDRGAGNVYWARADFRVVMIMASGMPLIRVQDAAGNDMAAASTALATCGAASFSKTFYNHREAKLIDMLNVDMQGLLDCIHSGSLMGMGKGLDDATDDGLVFYFGVLGPDQDTINSYGVRLFNAAELASTDMTAPAIKGLTVVTGQALYLRGDYNTVNKKPAAALADTINFLSNAWLDSNTMAAVSARVASDTGYNVALMSATDSTGSAEGTAGQDGGVNTSNGGLGNFMRLHENWSGRTLFYRGSWVSLNQPRHVNGAIVFGGNQFTAPVRDWNFDTDFAEDFTLLPPLPPHFVYLRQELFVRHFEL